MLTIAAGQPLLTPEAMRAAEASAIAAGTPALVLMERAAAASVAAIRRFCPSGEALVLCGPGNNGGDGYGVACLLRDAGVKVRVAASGTASGDPAAVMAARWGGPVESLADAAPAPVIIDALFGAGLARPIPETVQAAIDRLRGAGAIVVAIDIASGVDAASGAALGRPLAADMTVTFAAMKRGHATGAGRALTGRPVVADIGLGPTVCPVRLVPAPRRLALPADTHKFRRGAVLVIEGNAARGGAAGLTALAALRSGAGVVTIAGTSAPADAIMRRSDSEARAMLGDRRLGAIAIGPGLVDDTRTRDWLARVLVGAVPAVIDAGAFALLPAIDPVAALAAAAGPIVLTPHDGEFVRLFGAIGPDRIGAAQAAAIASDAVVVLKGAETIIAAPDGRAAVNTHAAAWLATAGSGDALTGIIAGLIAQGLAPFDAARAGVWLHGDCGIRGGPGLIADDIPGLLPAVLAGL
ncbi:MAG: NAD(P)H-hydrate dehydratase [Sandarakinorhabdus sp.]|nr:NAD(P)H-hydrate dehydratase [Sandarakinorhabdus sp.]